MSVRGHQLAVDWSGGGAFAGPLEDVSSYVSRGDIEISWGRDVSGPVTLGTSAGQLGFTLDNESQVFSPESTASPIAGRVLPGRRVRYQVEHQGTIYTLLAGRLDDFEVSNDIATEFTGTALDGWGVPGAEKLSTALHRGLRTGDAVHLVLDAIGWAGPRDVDPGATVMPWWWEEGTDAATAITRLVNSEGAPAIAFVQGDTFVFRDRHHRVLRARSATAVATADTSPSADLPIEAGSFRYDHGTKRIVNSATFAVAVRSPRPFTEVWSSEDPIFVAAGSSVQIAVEASEPFCNAITPTVASGDVRIASGAVSSTQLSRTSGQAATLTITCVGDTLITRLAVRANPVPVTRTVQVSARDNGSVGTYGPREWPTESAPVWANVYDAQVIASRVVSVYATYRPTITFTAVGLTAAQLTAMLGARISDRVTVRNDRRGIDGDFTIERLTHRITSLGVIHRIEVTCQAVEPAQAASPLTFDVAGRGFGQGAFAVDGIDAAGSVFRFDVAGQGFNQGVFAN